MSLSMSSPNRRTVRRLSNVTLLIVGVLFLVPMLWIVLASFDSTNTLSIEIPKQFTVANYAAILTPSITFQPLLNSLLLSGGCGIITVLCAILAAYPLSRYRMRVTKPFLYAILFGTCLPITAIMVPVYSLFVSLDLIDSLPGTMLFLASSSLPIAIYMMKNFIDAVPVSLEEAAWVDGASSMVTCSGSSCR